MDDGRTTTVGPWASLPLDLLIEIFRRLESTAVIRCACACKSWRRGIISNASFLRPRPDRFVPSQLVGVFHGYGDDFSHQHVYLRRTPGPFQSAALSLSSSSTAAAAAGSESGRIQSLIPATGGFDRELYTDLLSSRDGFILLGGRRWWSGLCLLCNPMTGACKIIPDSTIRSCTYVLLTGYDDDLSPSGGTAGRTANDHHHHLAAVRILAVAARTGMMCTEEKRITYQVFSFAASSGGAWGPVKRSAELKTTAGAGFWVPVYDPCTVVSGDAVYWLAGPMGFGSRITCAVALDVRTGRAWTTELPKGTQFWFWYYGGRIVTPTLLATAGDGRLSLIRSLCSTSTGGHQIQVWVLIGDDDDGQWSLQKTIDVQVQKLLPNFRRDDCFSFRYTCVLLNAFCPRSGCVIGRIAGQEIRIHLEGSSSRPRVECIGTGEGFYYCNNTYEMDLSTYISKMKQL